MKVLKESGKMEDELRPLRSEICLKVFKDGGARDNNGTGDPEQQWELKLKRLTSKIEGELRKTEISTSSKPPAPEISDIWKKIDDDIEERRIKRAKWKKDKDAEAKDNLGVQEQYTDRIQAIWAPASSGVATFWHA